MPVVLRCSVPGCPSTNATEQVYKFPFSRELFGVWKLILEKKCPEIILTQDKDNRCQKYICRLHFEDKYMFRDGRRTRFAIPTLFTEEEIAKKTPEHPIKLDHPQQVFDNYTKLRRLVTTGNFTALDHPYACEKDIILVGLERTEIPNKLEVINGTQDSLKRNDIGITLDPETEDDVLDLDDPEETEINNTNDEQHNREPPDPFSWQAPDELISVEDHYLNTVPLKLDVSEEIQINATYDNVAINVDVAEETKIDSTNGTMLDKTHREYYCDNCMKEIIRYTCVQCDNFDLCRACETQLVHPHHYMLRVPAPRPFYEVKSILDAVRKRIKILTEIGHSDGVEIKEESDETIEVMQDLAKAQVWIPTEPIQVLDASKDWQKQNMTDESAEIQDEPEIAISEAEEWLDDALLACADDEFREKGLTVPQTVPNSPDQSLLPEPEISATEYSDFMTLVDPLSISAVKSDMCENMKTDLQHLENIASLPKRSLQHHKPRFVTLCRSEIELVSLDSSPPTNRVSRGRVETQGTVQDSYGRLETQGTVELNTYPDLDQEIQQALNEIWLSDSVPTMKKAGTKRNPINIYYESKRSKISNMDHRNDRH